VCVSTYNIPTANWKQKFLRRIVTHYIETSNGNFRTIPEHDNGAKLAQTLPILPGHINAGMEGAAPTCRAGNPAQQAREQAAG
jgi:hypothetical protein